MEDIFGCVIICVVAVVMIIIGIVQYRSKTPVTFYNGEKPYKEEELTDVKAWNNGHGMLWMGYGFAMVLGCVLSIVVSNNFWATAFLYASILVPLPVMIKCHQLMIKKYKKAVVKKKREDKYEQ